MKDTHTPYHDSRGSPALRAVLGIAWLPRDTPIDVFLEIAPSLRLTPSSGFALDAALGARYSFQRSGCITYMQR